MNEEPSAKDVNSSTRVGVEKHSFQKLIASKRKHTTLVGVTYI
jgi:hypothetical protein